MASIASLVISLGANIAGFETDMTRANKNQQRRMKEMERAVEQAATVIATAFAATAGAMTAVVLSTAKTADEMQKMALRTGITTEALSQYKHVADLSGVSIEQFGKGISKMQRSISDASNGLVTQQRAFDRLGISVDDLLKLSPDKQFEEIAGAIAGLESATLRSASAQEIFGRSGTELLSVMANGKDGIQALREEADRFGLTISQEFADNAAQFNDNLERMGSLAQGASRQFTGALLPSLVGIQETMLEGVTGMDAFARAGEFVGDVVLQLYRGFVLLWGVLKTIAAALIGIAATIKAAFDAILAPIKATVAGLAEAATSLAKGDFKAAADALSKIASESASNFNQAFRDMKAGIDEVAGSTIYFDEALDKSAKALANASKGAKSTANSFGNMGDQTIEAADGIKGLEKAAAMFLRVASTNKRELQDHIDALEESARKQIAYNKAIQDFIDIGDPVGALVREFEQRLKFANEALAKGDITAQQYQASINNLTDALGKAAAGFQDVAEESDLMKEAMLEGVRILERSFQSVWQNIFSGSEDVFDSIVDGFQSMLASLQNAASTRKIFLQIENAFDPTKSVDFKMLGEGLAALAGQLAGGVLGGGGQYANIGAGIGALAGSFIPGLGNILGSIVGGALGGIFGGLFDSDRPAILQVSGFDTSRLSKSDTDNALETAFGKTFLRSRRVAQSEIEAFMDVIAEFDAGLAAILDDSQIGRIAEALKTWNKQIEGESLSAEQLLESRFATILATFSGDIRAFVGEVSSLEEQASRLQVGVSAESLFGSRPELFSGRTVKEFLAVVEAFQDGTETITDAFNEVLTILNSVVTVTKSLKDFAASDLGADFAEQMALAGRSLTQVLADMGSDLFDAIANFDGTPQSLAAIGDMVQSIRLKEMELLAQIDAIQKGLNANLESLRANILGLTEGPKTGADFFNAARDLVQQVLNAGSIEDVAALERQFSSLIGAISPEDQIAMQGPILQLIDSFQAAANDVMGDFRADALESAQSMRDLVDVFANDIADPLALIAASNDRAAAALELISGQEQGFADPMDTADETPGLIDRIIAANGTASQDQNRILEDGMQELSRVMADGGDYMAAAVVNAIRQVQIRNNIVVRESDLVTR